MFNAYVLHTRQYQDSSLIIDCFVQEQGIMSMIAKGARRPKSRWRGVLQPFMALLLNMVGKSELKTLVECEAIQAIPLLSGRNAFYGFYINEILLRVLKDQENHAEIFTLYEQLLSTLQAATSTGVLENALRLFEYTLLHILGYGLDVTVDANQQAIEPDIIYQYDEQLGLIPADVLPQSQHSVVISGASLLALHYGNLITEMQLKEAKQFMRVRLRPHIGDKPLQSRLLFKKVKLCQLDSV